MRNTPGPGGYLIAWVVSVVSFGVLLALWGLAAGDGELLDLASGAYLVTFFAFFYSIPFAAVGIPVVHLACRKVRAQWVHVVVAGLAGLSPMVTFMLLGGPWDVMGAPVVPVATMIGRWCVVPLVTRRRVATPALVASWL
ncbi:MAG TPA: hypothetical protein VN088_01580 [Nocardioides sp.]|nr:hypothetical protein [Nocardioides sp.]